MEDLISPSKVQIMHEKYNKSCNGLKITLAKNSNNEGIGIIIYAFP